MPSAGKRTFFERYARYGLIFCGLFVMMLAWAVASPASSGPDESGHIMKAAATLRGDFAGTPTGEAGIRSFQLPAELGEAGGNIACFAFRSEQAANCAVTDNQSSSDVITVNSGVAAYNPLYYAFVGLPSLVFGGETAVIAMRAFSALLSAALWTIAYAVLAKVVRRPALAVAVLAVGMTPFAVYLGGLVNPSGTETAGAVALTVLAMGLAKGSLSATPRVIGLTVAVAVVLCNLRSISPLIAAIAVALGFIAYGSYPIAEAWRHRANRWFISIGGVGAAFAAYWALVVSSKSGFIPTSPDRPGFLEAFRHTLDVTFDYGRMAIGVFGWLDATLPEPIYGIWMALFGFAVIAALVVAKRRLVVTMVVGFALAVVVPAITQALSAKEFGYIWQGRYSLPFLAAVIAVAAVGIADSRRASSADRDRESERGFIALWVCLAFLHLFAFAFVLRRYVVGLDGSWSDMLLRPEWSPGLGSVGIVGVLVVFAGGVGALIVGLWRIARRHELAGDPSRDASVHVPL